MISSVDSVRGVSDFAVDSELFFSGSDTGFGGISSLGSQSGSGSARSVGWVGGVASEA